MADIQDTLNDKDLVSIDDLGLGRGRRRRGQVTGDPGLRRENLEECPHCKTCDLMVSGDDMQVWR